MISKCYSQLKNIIFPCLFFSVITGVWSACIITAFKILAEWFIHLSKDIYGAVREDPIWLPILVIGATAIGLAASFLLSLSQSCRGGGIPTSIAAIRGIVSFRWIVTILLLPVSAFLTYLAGLPLGTEGPGVQIGTAIGDGVVTCFTRNKHNGWRRYIMTGGASAGFSIVTASPISAIIFSMEELHKSFSPLVLSVVSVAVATAQVTIRAFAALGIGSVGFFDFPEIVAIDLKLIYVPFLVGAICGCCSVFFTHLYHVIDRAMRLVLGKISIKVLFPLIFAVISLVGFFLSDALGTGHSLIDELLVSKIAWYLLIIIFLVRAVGMMVSNTSGVTGGVFLPILAFGAIIGAICGEVMVALGWIGAEHYVLVVVLGTVSFLGSTSRIPLTACVFAIEALNGINNVLPIVIATTVALLVVEASGIEDFTDAVIEAKIHKITHGKKAYEIEAPLTVMRGAFVIGKELRDVLWPNSCAVVSYNRNKFSARGVSEGDVIVVRYITYDPIATEAELNALVGEQSNDVIGLMRQVL